MSKSQVGVIIGRFQVPELHEGHRRLFEEVSVNSDRVAVLLGVSPVDGYTAENPLTFLQRQAIVRQSASLIPRSIPSPLDDLTILPLPDQRTNALWSAQLDALLRSTFPPANYDITLYGGRNSFKDSYSGGIPVKDSAFHPPIPVTGTQRRADIKEKNSADFYAGQIYALQRQYPRCFPTVDIAVYRYADGQPEHVEVLLIQRADSGNWCFPGGFVDPGETFKRAAQRELSEELGLTQDLGTFSHIDSFAINDFRYRGSRDKITTSFFAVPFTFGMVTCNADEVQDYKWERVFGRDKDNPRVPVSEVHTPLWNGLREHFRALANADYQARLDAAHGAN